MQEPSWYCDADIEQASTPPAELYTDRRWFDHLCERVLKRAWHWVGDASLFAEQATAVPVEIFAGAPGEPLLLSLQDNGTLRALSNVCTHRGALVCNAPTRARALRCPYHGRVFRLDGTCQSAPEMTLRHDFPTRPDDLRRVPLETWNGLHFAALETDLAFGEWTREWQARLGWIPWHAARRVPERTKVFEVQANWALYCENYLEGLHVPFVHGDLAAAIEFQSYATELWSHGSLQIARAQSGQDAFDPPCASADSAQRIAGYYVFLFPTTMLNVYPWGISLNVVQPLDVARTRIVFHSYVWDSTRLDAGASRDLERVELEDERIVESVQRGMRARLRSPGSYSPTRETGVHQFHRLLLAALARS